MSNEGVTVTDVIKKIDNFYIDDNNDVVIYTPRRITLKKDFVEKMKNDFFNKLRLVKFELSELSELEKFALMILTDKRTY